MEFFKKNIEAHLLDIDDEYIKNLQDQKVKKEKIYNMEEKKIIIISPINNLVLSSNQSVSYDYYSNFKSFRDILTREIHPEDYLHKIAEIEDLINFSKNYRVSLNNFLENDNFQNIEQFNNESLDYYANFVQSCKLLKEKENNVYDKNNKNFETSQYFTMYSELKVTADGKSNQLTDSYQTNKYVAIKEKLRYSYYQESFFNELYSQKNLGKVGNVGGLGNLGNKKEIQDISNKFSEKIRMKLPVEYVDSIFRSRDNESFLQIDTFMSKYGKKPQITNFKEKNLYENIYSLFSDQTSTYFLSYLYSKNHLFKYIYDEFSVEENKSIPITGEQFFLNENQSIDLSPEIRRRNSFKNFKEIDNFIGHYFFDKVICLYNAFDKKQIDILFKKKGLDLNNENDLKEELNKIELYFKKLLLKDKQTYMIITKNKKLKFLPNIEDIDQKTGFKLSEIEDPINNTKITLLDKNYLKEIIQIDIVNEESFINSDFFMIQIKYDRRYSGTESQNIGGDDTYNKNLIIKIPENNKKPLELIISHFELDLDDFERNSVVKVVKSEAKTKPDSTIMLPTISIKNTLTKDAINNPNENVIKSLHLLMQGKPKEESPSNKDGKDSKDSKLITFQNQPSLSISKKNNDKNDKISFEKEHIASDDDDHLDNYEIGDIQKEYFIKQTMITTQSQMAKNLKTEKESNNEEEDYNSKKEGEFNLTTKNLNTKTEAKSVSPDRSINCRISGVNYLLKFNFEKDVIQYHNPNASLEDLKVNVIRFDNVKELIAGDFNTKNKAIVSIIFKESTKKKLDIYITGIDDYDFFIKNFNSIVN